MPHCCCCFNPIHGYWTQQWQQIPYSCINGSINEVCTKCSPQRFDTNHPKKNLQNIIKDDTRDNWWFGRCKMDRPDKNPFTNHLRRPNPCRHRGRMGSLNNRCTNCTPEFMKFFLLSPAGSEKRRCFYQPLIDDPFEIARLTETRNVAESIPFIHQDLDKRLGHWHESNFDEFGNPLSDVAIKRMRRLLMERPGIEKHLPYEKLDKEWLNNICEFYRQVVGEDS